VNPARNPVFHDTLGQRERRKDVVLEVVPHEIERDLGDRAAFADARVIDENVKIPIAGARDIVRVEQVELLDTNGRKRERFQLEPQRSYLRPCLSSCDNFMSVANQSDRCPFAET
jgi:hypothetical protein